MGRSNVELQQGMGQPHVALLPIAMLKKYREYNRAGKDALGHSFEHLEWLTKDIAENGVQEPLQLTHENGRGMLAEGNHRLIAAERAGFTHVPVTVWNRGRVSAGKGAPLTWVGDENRHGYMPAQAHPSNYKELQ